jgi:hypothetical protein
MNVKHITELQDLITWAKETLNVSANLEISFWHHSHNEAQDAEYKLWIKDTFSQSTKDSEMLIALIPYIKNLCNNKLRELAQ